MAKNSTNNSKRIQSDDAKEMEKILAVVVKRRKTFPVKCMELCKQMLTLELTQLENSTVIDEKKNFKREDFKRVMQRTKKLKYIKFSLADLEKAEKKLLKHYSTVKNISRHLEELRKVQTELR